LFCYGGGYISFGAGRAIDGLVGPEAEKIFDKIVFALWVVKPSAPDFCRLDYNWEDFRGFNPSSLKMLTSHPL
jgi:hypothetical protein